MIPNLWLRLLILCVFILGTGGMMVDYARHAEEESPYPTEKEVRDDYQSHVGERVNFWSRVSAVREEGIVIHYGVTLFVPVPEPDMDSGDWVQVYGTLRPEQRLAPGRIVTSQRSNRSYMLGVSIISLLGTLGLFIRYWRIDTECWTITPRTRD